MRKINIGDTFKFARIIKGASLQNIIQDAYKEGKKEDASQEEVGLNAILNIVCSCCDEKMESKIYELMAGITEKTEDMIKNQSLDTTISDIKDICRENNITNFLKSAFRLSESIKS